MNVPRIRTILFASGALLFAPAARAAVDAFIWFDSIQGESKDPQHQNWIEVESYQLQEVNRQASIGSATSGAGAGRVSLSSLTVSKLYDKSSPLLSKAYASGKHFQTVIIEMRKAGGTQHEYLKITLQSVMISSYQLAGGGAGGSGNPAATETLTFNFGAMKMEYTGQTKATEASHLTAAQAPGAIQLAPTATPTPARRAAPPVTR